MKVVSGEEFEYNWVVKGVLLISKLWNESIFDDDDTVKLALLYKGYNAVKKHVKGLIFVVEDESKMTNTNSRHV